MMHLNPETEIMDNFNIHSADDQEGKSPVGAGVVVAVVVVSG